MKEGGGGGGKGASGAQLLGLPLPLPFPSAPGDPTRTPRFVRLPQPALGPASPLRKKKLELERLPGRRVARTKSSSEKEAGFFSFCFFIYRMRPMVWRSCRRTHNIPPAARTKAARCRLPFALRPGLFQGDIKHTKEAAKGRQKGNAILLLFCRGHEGGCRKG